jgi:hypothetical protein
MCLRYSWRSPGGPQSHGLADRHLLGGLLVSCVIGRAEDFLHGTPPRALDLREKWRRSCRKRRHISVRGDDKNRMRICRSPNPCSKWAFNRDTWSNKTPRYTTPDNGNVLTANLKRKRCICWVTKSHNLTCSSVYFLHPRILFTLKIWLVSIVDLCLTSWTKSEEFCL